MKFSLATALLMAGSAAAFTTTPSFARSSALKMSTVTETTYTFAKSEEIFAEAQTVSFSDLKNPMCPLKVK
jgi:hypothetical protein